MSPAYWQQLREAVVDAVDEQGCDSVLILHGTDDAMVPLAHGHDLARVIPGARLHTLRGWGHDLPEALSAEFAALIAEHARVRAVSLG